jgi:MFS transporter, DHA1 family, inner membrane transport protein
LKRKEIIVVSLLALVNFTHILDFMIMMPLGNLLMPLWKLNTAQFANVVAGYPIAAFVSAFCAIFFADKFDRKHLLLFAYFGFLIGTFMCGQAIGYQSMMAARVITGLFGGMIGAQVMSMIGDFVPYERRGQAMGILMSGFALASVIGVPLSLFLANHFAWNFPFYLIAGQGLLLFFILWKVLPNFKMHLENPIKLKDRAQNFVDIFSNRTQIIALALGSCLMMGHFFIIPLINPYLVNNVKIDIKYTPLVYLFGGIATILASNITGKLADKYGKYIVFKYAILFAFPCIFAVTNMPVWPLWLVLFIYAIWFAVTTSRSVPAQAMITQSVTAQTRGSFMSFSSCLQSLGTGIATLISGKLTYNDAKGIIHGYPYLGYISMAVIAFCFYLGWVLQKRIGVKMNEN